jgi:signal transduction histidine kinase
MLLAVAQAEVTAARARIVAAADQARRRIERDLHDGTQQRLGSTCNYAPTSSCPARWRSARVEALGGRIFLDSRRGAGTSLQAEFPLTATNDGVTSR